MKFDSLTFIVVLPLDGSVLLTSTLTKAAVKRKEFCHTRVCLLTSNQPK